MIIYGALSGCACTFTTPSWSPLITRLWCRDGAGATEELVNFTAEHGGSACERGRCRTGGRCTHTHTHLDYVSTLKPNIEVNVHHLSWNCSLFLYLYINTNSSSITEAEIDGYCTNALCLYFLVCLVSMWEGKRTMRLTRTKWTCLSDRLHCGPQTAAEAPKICIPDLRFQESVGNKGVEMGFI